MDYDGWCPHGSKSFRMPSKKNPWSLFCCFPPIELGPRQLGSFHPKATLSTPNHQFRICTCQLSKGPGRIHDLAGKRNILEETNICGWWDTQLKISEIHMLNIKPEALEGGFPFQTGDVQACMFICQGVHCGVPIGLGPKFCLEVEFSWLILMLMYIILSLIQLWMELYCKWERMRMSVPSCTYVYIIISQYTVSQIQHQYMLCKILKYGSWTKIFRNHVHPNPQLSPKTSHLVAGNSKNPIAPLGHQTFCSWNLPIPFIKICLIEHLANRIGKDMRPTPKRHLHHCGFLNSIFRTIFGGGESLTKYEPVYLNLYPVNWELSQQLELGKRVSTAYQRHSVVMLLSLFLQKAAVQAASHHGGLNRGRRVDGWMTWNDIGLGRSWAC